MAFKVADTFVKVGADLTSYRKGLKDAEADAGTTSARIKAAFNSAFKGPDSGVANVRAFVRDLRAGAITVADLKDQAAIAGRTLKTAFASAGLGVFHNGLNAIKGVLGGLKGLASDIFKGFSIGLGIGSFQALGRVLSDLVNVIPDLINRGREYSRTVDDIADATGATTKHASQFTSTLMFMGQTTGGVINMIGQMSRNLEEQGPILEKLGIRVTDMNGGLLNQLQILDNARKAMSAWGRGTVQSDQIAREFGRGGLRTLVDYLQLTDEQFKKITDDAQKQGLILTDAQRDLGESMIREQARFQNALVGLGETIFTIVGPQIRAFMSNLSDFIQEHVTEISTAIANAISFILGLVTALVGAKDSLDSFAGSVQAMNASLSPYSARLIQARLELGKLELQQEKTTDGTDAQRKAITAQIKVIEREIEVLKRQERAQDTVFKRTIAGLSRVYQLRLDNLDLAERERENLERQRDLNDQLNQAQIDLQDALRGKVKDGGQTAVDAEDVSKAMARIAEIQRDQADLARQTEVDAQRKSLESTRDYIDSIADLLEKAENKRAALNTLRRREDVLEARRQAQLAAGDTGGAEDTTAKIEALKTAQVRAEEQIRNGDRESVLDRQKELLQEERAAIRAVVVDTTAIRKRELAKQIADLEAQELAWSKLTGKERDDIATVTSAFSGAGGLTAAMREARDAGVEFGEDVKEAIGGLVDILADLFGWLGDIKKSFDEISDSEVFKFLTEPVDLKNAPNFVSPGKVSEGVKPGLTDIVGEWLHKLFLEPQGGGGQPPSPRDEGRAMGGWLDKPGWFFGAEKGREYVLDHALSEKLDRFFSGPQTPALAMAGGGGETIVVPVYLDGEVLTRVVSRRQERSRGR